jgi:hypothetical protein
VAPSRVQIDTRDAPEPFSLEHADLVDFTGLCTEARCVVQDEQCLLCQIDGWLSMARIGSKVCRKMDM